MLDQGAESVVAAPRPSPLRDLSGRLGASAAPHALPRNRCGVLQAPEDLVAGDVVGVGVPRSAIGAPARPDRVLLHTGDGELRTELVLQSVA